jgi:hypothetical protein
MPVFDSLEFSAHVRAQLDEYLNWAKHHCLSDGRLVQYVGLGQPNAINLNVAEVCAQIEGCLNQGLQVRWEQRESRIYLAIQEPDCPMPPWDKVFSEEAVSDIESILRQAGLSAP